jgi:hypothetical protein
MLGFGCSRLRIKPALSIQVLNCSWYSVLLTFGQWCYFERRFKFGHFELFLRLALGVPLNFVSGGLRRVVVVNYDWVAYLLDVLVDDFLRRDFVVSPWWEYLQTWRTVISVLGKGSERLGVSFREFLPCIQPRRVLFIRKLFTIVGLLNLNGASNTLEVISFVWNLDGRLD